MSDSLPEHPDLAQLGRRAKELRDAARRGDPAALARLSRFHVSPGQGDVSLAAAQLVIARELGFPSWPRLKAAIEARLRAVSFFDDFPPRQPPPRPGRPFEPKPWSGPPPGWVGGFLPWHLVVLRSSDVYAVLGSPEVFHSGVALTTHTRFRPGTIDTGPGFGPRGAMMMWNLAEGPLLGVRFADGCKALLRPPPFQDEEPADPVLTPRGGGGGPEEWRQDIWLWPLPPPGQLSFVTAWPAKGIAETVTTVDATELSAAASRSRQLWEIPPGQGPGLSFARR